ncbi:MAG: hypothetical protein Q8M47_00215 [Devosia sp.]|nr:hypothetical protein [Devosia sp.]
MKLTWFAGSTIRIHIGGRILVADPAGISGVDAGELVSGADATFFIDEAGEAVDPALWQPRRAAAMIDSDAVPEVLVHGIEGGALVAAAGEPPLVLLKAPMGRAGRWARDAVVVVFGDAADALAAQVLEDVGPYLIAIAAGDAVIERAIVGLRDKVGETLLVALEPGMALEV